MPDRRVVAAALGLTQILAWGSTFYLFGVLAHPIALDTDWDYQWVICGVTVGLLMAGVISPRIGRAISNRGSRLVLALSAVLLASGSHASHFLKASVGIWQRGLLSVPAWARVLQMQHFRPGATSTAITREARSPR
jgi:hypothetical protein